MEKRSQSAVSVGKVLVVVLLLVAAACTSTPNPQNVYQRITEAKLKPGDAIPAPGGESILQVTGKIGVKNSGESIQMDMATIESVGIVEYKVTDPFEKRPTVFRGVLMSALLDLWKVDQSATTLEMIALNDYKVDVPIETIRKFPAIFATQQDGAYMEVSKRGPAMLVYPYDHYQFDRQQYDAYWIWQIKSISVK